MREYEGDVGGCYCGSAMQGGWCHTNCLRYDQQSQEIMGIAVKVLILGAIYFASFANENFKVI